MKLSEWRLKMTEGVSKVLNKLEAGADKVSNKFVRVQDNINRARQQIRDAADEIPYFNQAVDLIKNPFALLAAGTLAYGIALGSAGKKSLDYEQGMAKINTTTQLTREQLAGLRGELMDVGRGSGGNFARIPETFEQTVSLLNDIPASLDVVRTAAMGAKAGFTDIDIVAKGLGKTLSIVGAENTNAMEVLDTFQAAKDLGAGEFEDFASYMPRLIADGKNLGLEYKETAGLFSFMTTKASEAGDAAMLMQNAFAVLGRKDILDNLSGIGVDVFDADGAVKSFGSIFQDLGRVVEGMSDQQRVNLLDQLGLRDQQARQAFSILISDTEKLNATLVGTQNAAGSARRALENASNPLTDWRNAQDDLNFILTTLGYAILPVLQGGIDLVSEGMNWLANNSRFVEGAMIALGVILGGATIAMIAFNTALWANPITWVVMLLAGLVVMFAKLWAESDTFRANIMGLWEVLKGFGTVIKDYVITRFKELLSGIIGIGKALMSFFKGDWKEAWETGKQATNDLLGIGSTKQLATDLFSEGQVAGDKFKSGYAEGLKSDGSNTLADIMDFASDKPSMASAGLSSGGMGTPTLGSTGQQKSKAQDGLKGISGGGKQLKSVTVTINKLVEQIRIEAKETAEQMQDIDKLVQEALIRAVRGGELAISNEY